MGKKKDKVDTYILDQAGIDIMNQMGKPIRKKPRSGNAKIYEQSVDNTVRVRTNNDRILIAKAKSTDPEAELDIEGTDQILLVMPREKRTHGAIVAYLIPTATAADEIRSIHKKWLRSKPNTKGKNKTWNLHFDTGGKIDDGN